MKIVGLTGGIGSGKSTVAEMFKELDVPVYDSDFEAKRLMIDSAKLMTLLLFPFGDGGDDFEDEVFVTLHVTACA